MVDYLSRADWGARPAEGATALRSVDVDGYAEHWPGMSAKIDATGDAGKRRIASALRGWQTYHMDTRGWSDIAYQVAIDQAGRAWICRGLNIRSAANGDADVNERFGAFLLILGPGEAPTAAMKATARAVAADFIRMFPSARPKPYGHRDVRPRNSQGQETTDCPGDIAYAAIQRGEFTPTTTSTQTGDLDVDEKTLRAIIADELNKQDRDLWINGTGQSQVIAPLKRLEAKVADLEATVAALS